MSVIKVIFWDFDGVLINSNMIRDSGFERVLEEYPSDQVEQLLAYHRSNGGLSRYIKFRYFFEKIRNEAVSDEQIMLMAERFSFHMRDLLVNTDLLIQETMDFVINNHTIYSMYITSASDQDELRYLCNSLGISQFFISIYGSPKSKKEWLKDLIEIYAYDKSECVLIGDSFNDFEAAQFSEIHFLAYNNPKLQVYNTINPLF